MPPRTNIMFIIFNLSMGSFRNIHAEMQTKNVEVDPIILKSPIGICRNAQFPTVIAAVPHTERPRSCKRLPFGKIGCFLEIHNNAKNLHNNFIQQLFEYRELDT